MPHVSGREFSRIVGRSEMFIRKLIAQGVLVKDGKKMDEQLNLKRMIDHGYLRPDEIRVGNAPANIPTPKPVDVPRETLDKYEGITIAEARRLRAIADAETARLQADKLKGELVEKRAVYAELFEMGQVLREKIQAVPDRVIDLLLSQPSRTEAHNVLADALRDVLNEMSKI